MWCEIKLFEHPDNTYKPGDRVHGIVKYDISQEKEFNAVTVSLKGLTSLRMEWTEGFGDDKKQRKFDGKEDLVDIDSIIHNSEKKQLIPAGTHEAPFSFMLPVNIPPSFKFVTKKNESLVGNKVHCEFSYFVRVKFGRPRSLIDDKEFRTVIKVIGTLNSDVSRSPSLHEAEKIPFQPFWKKITSNLIRIHCTIENPVTSPGGQVKLNYIVDNRSQLNLKGVNIKLTHEFEFQRNGYPVIEKKDLACCSASPVKKNDSQTMEFLMDIPKDALTLEHSTLVSRNYFINIVAVLPYPHRDAVVKAPIFIVQPDLNSAGSTQYDDLPPSYSEAMAEYNKDELEK